MQTIHEVNDIRDLAQVRDAWSSLLTETTSATFFQSLEWLEVYWKHFSDDQKLRVLLVFDGSTLVGVLPLVVRRESTKVGKIRFLTYPPNHWATFFGPIGRDAEMILDAGLKHIRRTKRDWDALELRWIGPTDDACRLTKTVMRRHRFQACQSIIDHAAVIDLAGTWDDYLASRKSKWRNNYRRSERRLSEYYDQVSFFHYRPRGIQHDDADPRWDLYDACLEIAQASWQGESVNGTTLSHDSVSQFLRDVHTVAAKLGTLDLNLLLLDGRPMAFAYNYHYRGYVNGLRAGYDSAASQDGVGSVLYARAIQNSFELGDRVYDLGPGSLKSKRHYQTRVVPIYRISHFPLLAVRSQFLRLKRHLDNRSLAS